MGGTAGKAREKRWPSGDAFATFVQTFLGARISTGERAMRIITASSFALLVATTEALAWGERGHDLIARVAARLVAERGDGKLGALLLDKEHQLGHLANVPDIVWRGLGQATEAVNGPTHYIDVEFFDLTPTFAEMPASAASMKERMQELCAAPPKDYVCPVDTPAQTVKASLAGTAPFRIEQLFKLLKQSFAKVKAAPAGDKSAVNTAVNEALLYGGVMAHFVGDLGNPLHTTRDYNGYERGQGGAHKYYESEAVTALDLTLDQDVYRAALKHAPLQRLEHVVPKDARSAWREDPLKIAFALILDSFAKVGEVYALDLKHAVTKKGSTERGMKIKAERRPAAVVAAKFRPLTTERLATAADALAALWGLAYRQAGSPELGAYDSWEYPTAPAFVPPDYGD